MAYELKPQRVYLVTFLGFSRIGSQQIVTSLHDRIIINIAYPVYTQYNITYKTRNKHQLAEARLRNGINLITGLSRIKRDPKFYEHPRNGDRPSPKGKAYVMKDPTNWIGGLYHRIMIKVAYHYGVPDEYAEKFRVNYLTYASSFYYIGTNGK